MFVWQGWQHLHAWYFCNKNEFAIFGIKFSDVLTGKFLNRTQNIIHFYFYIMDIEMCVGLFQTGMIFILHSVLWI
jgi:hypothetical protein